MKKEFTGQATSALALLGEIHDESLDVQIDTGDPPVDTSKIEDVTAIEIQTGRNAETDRQQHLRAQVERSRNDRSLVSRFIGCVIFIVGLVNLLPAIYHWYVWSLDPLNTILPKWIFMLVFIAALHLLYSLFAFQIADWSALRAVAVVVLVFAAVFVFVFSELLIGKAESKIAAFVDLPNSMLKTAIIWTAAMLLMELITCYLTARESFLWQRTEYLSDRLLTESDGK